MSSCGVRCTGRSCVRRRNNYSVVVVFYSFLFLHNHSGYFPPACPRIRGETRMVYPFRLNNYTPLGYDDKSPVVVQCRSRVTRSTLHVRRVHDAPQNQLSS